MKKILWVDDDIEFLELRQGAFQKEGYTVDNEHDAKSALRRLKNDDNYAIVLLDISLPDQDGLEMIRQIRSHSQVPVVFVTGRASDVDRILGLEMGADDYVVKPFNTRELLARIKAVRRRYESNASKEPIILNVGDIDIDRTKRKIFFHQQALTFTMLEFEIMERLALQAGQLMTKEKLSQEVLGRDYEPADRSLDMHISNIRKKMMKIHPEEIIQTVRKKGYILTAS